MKLYAIIPAAGLSRRMGQPKLTMQLRGRSVISRLLEALDHPEVEATAVVHRRADSVLHAELQNLDIVSVRPELDPPDMRTSVEHGVTALQQKFSPGPDDGWLLIPADHPVLDSTVVTELIEAWSSCDADIMVPVFEGRRGHPTFFRWSLTERLAEIPENQGLNWLLKSAEIPVHETAVLSESILFDLDTPDDFRRLEQRFTEPP